MGPCGSANSAEPELAAPHPLFSYASSQITSFKAIRRDPFGWIHGWTPDLAVLAFLLAGSAAGGRAFAKLELAGHAVYPTELLLALVVVLAVWRCGIAGTWMRLRRLPLAAVAALWLAGIVATLRGLPWGLGNILHDIGLVEYSGLLAVAAIVADTPERARRLVTAILIAGVVAVPAYQIAWDTSPIASFGHWQNPGVAVAIYLSITILMVVARLFSDMRPSIVLIAIAIWSVWLMTYVGARSSLAAFAVGIGVMIALMPRHRLPTFGVLAVAFLAYVFGPWAWAGFPTQAPPPPAPAPAPLVKSYWIADDAMAGVYGGGLVAVDGARGTKESLQSRRGLPLVVPVILGLVPGRQYVVRFWVKAGARTSGYVGNSVGSGWHPVRWHVEGGGRWQAVRAVLVARRSEDQLELVFEQGPTFVLVDGLRITRPGTYGLPGPAPAAAPPKVTWREHLPRLLHDVVEGFNASDTSGASANSSWRLAIWSYMVQRTARDNPLFGIGFGKPTNFLYHGILFDGRRGIAADPNDQIPPHNSFVNLLFRTGLLGFVPLLVIIGVAIRRTLGARRRGLPRRDEADLVSVAALFAFAATIAFLNAALEGPYMSLFFWLPLGLLLVIPKLHELQGGHRRAAAE
jgi:hypothetical protein